MFLENWLDGLEWIARYIIERLDVFTGNNKIYMTGGAAANHIWPQIISDVCGITVIAVKMPGLTAYGAALSAAKVAGLQFKYGLADICETVIFEPQRKTQYQRWYQNYQKKYLSKALTL